MTDLAALGVSVDSDGVVKASDRLDGFEKSSDRAAGGATRVEKKSTVLSGSLKRLAGVAAGAVAGMASLAGAVRTVTSGLARIDAQAKLAQSLNTTTESIQILSRAADLTGSSFGEVEGGATRLTRRLSLFAADGGGPAAKAIEQLGLNAEQLLAVPLNERLQTIARALDENATAAERAGIASQLFGDRGFAAFDRLLQSGVIEGATADIRDLGVAVSDDVAAQVEEANDALSRLGLVFTAMGNEITAAVAPALTAFADGMIALRKSGDALKDVVQSVIDVTVILVATRIPAAIAGLGSLVLSIRAATAAMTIMELQFIAGTVAMRAMAVAAGVARGALALVGGPLGLIAGLVVGAVLEFRKMDRAAENLSDALGKVKRAQNDLNDAFVTYMDNTSKASIEALRRQAEAAIETTRSAIKAAQEELEAASFTTNFFGMSLGETDRMAEARAEIERLNTKLVEAESLLSLADNAAMNFESNLTRSGDAAGNTASQVGAIANEMSRAASEALSFINNLGRANLSGLRAEVGALRSGGSDREAFEASIRGSEDFQRALTGPEGLRQAALEGLNRELEAFDLRAEKAALSATKLGGGGGGGGGAIDEMTEAARAAQQILGQVNRESVTYADVVNELSAALNAGKISQEQFNDAVDIAGRKFDELERGSINLRESLSSVFADAVTGAKSLKEGLSGVLKQLASMLANRAFQTLLSGGLGGLGGGGGGLLGMGGFLGFLDSGGTIGAGQSAIVGERRPEIVEGPARVIGGAQTARMMQGGGGQQTQRSEITVKLDVPEGVTVEETRQIAGNVAVQVTQAGLRQNRKSLRGQINTLENRGTNG